MGADLSKIGILTRREIEARIAGPLIKAFIQETGEARALEIVEKVIVSLAKESGEMLRAVRRRKRPGGFCQGDGPLEPG